MICTNRRSAEKAVCAGIEILDRSIFAVVRLQTTDKSVLARA
jgi:hypothetical protein